MNDFNLIFLEQETKIKMFVEQKMLTTDQYRECELILNEAINTVANIIEKLRSEDLDVVCIKYLGVRMVNSVVSMRKLLTSGLYQNSLTILRDIIETGFLIDYFSYDSSKIQEWREADDWNKKRNFSPAVIRKELDKRDSFNNKQRDQIYSIYSEFAVHPNCSGMKLVMIDNKIQIGPFYGALYFIIGYESLSKLFPYFTLNFLKLFRSNEEEILNIQYNYIELYKELFEKDFFKNLSFATQ